MKRVLLFAIALMFVGFGCAQEKAMRGQPDTTRVGIGSNVGVKDGALIAHELEDPNKAQEVASTDKLIIVQCPACNQRVDVTGLPRDRIRCPNCNSLFTY